jgi:16S rRNA (guanine966-N2)-methyltransferase
VKPTPRKPAISAPAKLAKAPHFVRIIGGQWKRTRLAVADKPGLRPTPDRVRETLFNWLASEVPRSRCLDLFAGSGALGLEALSRGAAHATFVERDRESTARLRETAALLARNRATVIQADALAWLGGAPAPHDIVFLDPPFDAGLLTEAMRLLEARGWLAPAARIYIEMPARQGVPALPAGWRMHRNGRAGAVGYHLAVRTGEEPAT